MSSSTATIVSGLVGLFIGHILTRTWQFQQWKLENRKAEYRELLTKLSAGYFAALYYSKWSGTDAREKAVQTEMAATACIKDRIFIADDIERCHLLQRWLGALRRYDHSPTNETAMIFQKEFEAIRADVVKTALDSFRAIEFNLPPEDE